MRNSTPLKTHLQGRKTTVGKIKIVLGADIDLTIIKDHHLKKRSNFNDSQFSFFNNSLSEFSFFSKTAQNHF